MPSLNKNLSHPPADLDRRSFEIDASDDPHVLPGMRLGFRIRMGTGGAGGWSLVELEPSGVPKQSGAIAESDLTELGGAWLHGSIVYRDHPGSTELLVMFYQLLLPSTAPDPDVIHRVVAWSGHGLKSDAVTATHKLLTHNGTWHGSGGGD